MKADKGEFHEIIARGAFRSQIGKKVPVTVNFGPPVIGEAVLTGEDEKGLTFTMTIPQHEWQRGLEENFQSRARELVVDYFNNRRGMNPLHLRGDFVPLTLGDTYVVWFSKTLQNWKALVSTTVPDGMYYEVTYNGDKKETYLDAYEKVVNVVIPDGPREGDGP